MSVVAEAILPPYAAEAAFLWLLRDQAVRAPHYTLADLAKLDERIEAQLDGLRVAGNTGWEAAKRELEWQEPGEVFTAAVLAFESDDMARIQPVLAAARHSHELARGLIAALGWIPYKKVALRIGQLAGAQAPDLRRIGIAAAAFHRQDPGRVLTDSLQADDPSLRGRALCAAGELARSDLLAALRDHRSDNDETCRFSAAWSAALLGDRSLIPVLQSVAAGTNPHALPAMDMTMRCLELPAALAWHKQMAADPKLARSAAMAAGTIGDPILVPWLVEQTSIPANARIAGESFSTITGVDLSGAQLEGKPPEDVQVGPTENPEDENVAMDPDENLPWPEPELVRAWWTKHGREFASGTRYLVGKPMAPEALSEVLRTGSQRRRAAAALELALRQPAPKKPLFEVRAPAPRQLRMLGAGH